MLVDNSIPPKSPPRKVSNLREFFISCLSNKNGESCIFLTFDLVLQRVRKQSRLQHSKSQCHASALPAPVQIPVPPLHLPPPLTPVIQTRAEGSGQMGQEAPQDRTPRPPCPALFPFGCDVYFLISPLPPQLGELALQGGGIQGHTEEHKMDKI